MRCKPIRPSRDADIGKRDELRGARCERTRNRAAFQLQKQARRVRGSCGRVRSLVVEHKVRIAQEPAHFEEPIRAFNPPLKHNDAITQRRIGCHHRNAIDGVIDDFMHIEHGQGPRVRMTIDDDPRHAIRRHDILRAIRFVVDRHVATEDVQRIVERRKKSARMARAVELRAIDGEIREIEAVALEVGSVANRTAADHDSKQTPHEHEHDEKRGQRDHPSAATECQRGRTEGRVACSFVRTVTHGVAFSGSGIV